MAENFIHDNTVREIFIAEFSEEEGLLLYFNVPYDKW
jgi:hypothetical protein